MYYNVGKYDVYNYIIYISSSRNILYGVLQGSVL